MRRRFQISSLTLAGLTGLGTALAMPIPTTIRSDDELSNTPSLFQTFREAKPVGFKQHRSHRSHSSHGSHRSSSGGARPIPRGTPPPRPTPQPSAPESRSTSPSSVLPSSSGTSADAEVQNEINDIRRVQAMLSAYGYYTGAVDGIDGPLTRAAIARYQAAHQLPVTGTIDDALLRSLGLSTQ